MIGALRELFAWWREIDRRTATVLIAAAALPGVYVYQGHRSFWEPRFAAHGADWARTYANVAQFAAIDLLFLAVPLGAIFWFGDRPRDFGVGLGDWRFGAKVTAIAAVAVTPFLWLGADAAMQAEYPLSPLAALSVAAWALWSLVYLAYYVAWEFFFRGFMLFGLEKRLGAAVAILVQTIPSTMLHIGKPQAEFVAAIPGGIALGALAWRTRSILWPLLLHYYVGVMNDAFCILRSP